jgi:raffinose/stachyose/melibiose transport system substrate-binding protein
MIKNGKGTQSELTTWFGGGYAIINKSKYKKEAFDFLKWAFRSEGWAKTVWQAGITFPAQYYDQFLTGKETSFQKELSAILSHSKTYSDILNQEEFTPDTQKIFYDSTQKLAGFY